MLLRFFFFSSQRRHFAKKRKSSQTKSTEEKLNCKMSLATIYKVCHVRQKFRLEYHPIHRYNLSFYASICFAAYSCGSSCSHFLLFMFPTGLISALFNTKEVVTFMMWFCFHHTTTLGCAHCGRRIAVFVRSPCFSHSSKIKSCLFSDRL